MLNDPQKLIEEFVSDMVQSGRPIDRDGITFDTWTPPHQRIDMPLGHAAVYIFSLLATTEAPAGPNRVIKVGKAGPKSNERFRYQHYAPNGAPSTLAAAIENNPVLWRFIGYPGGGINTGNWLLEHTNRTNFYFQNQEVYGIFEVYAKARLGPVYEGSLSHRA